MQNLDQQTIKTIDYDQGNNPPTNIELVSFVQEIPEYLKEAMSAFIEKYPNWDQYRLVEAAISGYLLDKGIDSREINRIYSKSMFCKKAFARVL
tara:strand:+ start:259 stop:540 length:282 start_codon:yes stop_codon:yes gene_type:complete